MPLKTITNPVTGQTLQVADNALSPDTMNQYQAVSPLANGMNSPDMTSPAPAIQTSAYPENPMVPSSMPGADMPSSIQPGSTPQPSPAPLPMPFGVPQHGVMEQLEADNIAPHQLEEQRKQNQLDVQNASFTPEDDKQKKEPVFFNAVQNNQGMDNKVSINDHGLGSAFDKEKKALNAYGEAAAEKAIAEGKVYEEARQQMDLIAQNKEDMRMEYQKTFDEYEQNIQSLTKEASQGVDARRYWKNKSAFGKIGAALSVMAGAIGTSINQAAGGRMTGNAALDIVMDQIDEDIQAQRTNLANKNQEVKNQQTMYSMAMNKFNNDVAAQEATRIALLDQTKMRLAEMTANATSDSAKAQTQQAMAQLDQKKAESQIKLDQFARQEAEKKAQGIDRFIPGVGYAFSKEAANKTRDFNTKYSTMKNTLNQLITLRKKYGSQTMPGEAKAELKNLSATLQTLANQAVFELGALSADDLKMIKKVIPDGDDFGFVLKSYETFANTLDDRADNFYKNNIINYQGLPEKDPRFNANK